MTKTFKLGAIFLITVISLQIVRILFMFLNLSDNLASWLFSGIFQGLFLGLLPYLLYRSWIARDKGSYASDLRLNTKIHPASYPMAIGIGFLTFFINLGISVVWYMILTLSGYHYPNGADTIYSSPEVLIFELLATAVLPAIFEELINRGLLLAALDQQKNDRRTILIIGIFFGFLHQNVAQLGPTVFGGLVMAYMAVKCNNILPGMIVHFMNNALSILVSYGQQKGNAIGTVYNLFLSYVSNRFLLMVAVWIAAGVLLASLLKQFEKINRPYREASDPDPLPVPAQVVPSPKMFDEDFFEKIYGSSSPSTVSSSALLQNTLAPHKNRWWEYGLLMCAFLATFLSTTATYIIGRIW
jgi:membrane protease YdiL (CAAX protease family)